MVGDQGMHIVDPADNSPGQPLAAAHAHAPPAVHWRVAPTIDRRPVTDGRTGRRTGRGARLNRCSALAVALASVVALAGPLACGANAGEVAHLRAHLNPNHLGASTTIGFSLAINPTGGTSVSPLTGFSFGLPRGMGFLESTLGLQECQRAALLASGLSGCPDDSRLGTGHVSVELPFASGPISACQAESAASAAVVRPSQRARRGCERADGDTGAQAPDLLQARTRPHRAVQADGVDDPDPLPAQGVPVLGELELS